MQSSVFCVDVADMLKRLLTARRALDVGNAQVASLNADFSRFGLSLWDGLETADRRTSTRRRALEQLNVARNGVSHDDRAKLRQLVAEGVRLNVTTFRRWRSCLNGLAETMDRVLARHLAGMFGREPPWRDDGPCATEET